MLQAGGDWTSAMDDALTERLTHCSACGQERPVLVGIHVLDGLALATSVCRRCHTQDPQQVGVEARLRQRYAPGRFPTISHPKKRGERGGL